MITNLALQFLLSLIGVILSPLGIVNGLVFYVGSTSIDLAYIIAQTYAWYKFFADIIPFFSTAMYMFLAGLSLEFGFMTWQIVNKVIGWVRGSA